MSFSFVPLCLGVLVVQGSATDAITRSAHNSATARDGENSASLGSSARPVTM